MKVKPNTKYTVKFTEEEKEAIITICDMANKLYDNGLCEDLECKKCPFSRSFCMSVRDNDLKIHQMKQKLEKFINEE